MSQAQLTRLINWFALVIAFTLLALAGLHSYNTHISVVAEGRDYLFDDLPPPSAASLKADIQQIVQAHIMGEVPQIAVVPPKPVAKVETPKPAPAPKAKLDIRLTGVIDGATPESGFAMIEITRGKTAVLEVGEAIGNTEAVLHQVLPGEILIDRNGLIESVKMNRSTIDLAQQFPDMSLIDLMENNAVAVSVAGNSNEVAGNAIDEDTTYTALPQGGQLSADYSAAQQRIRDFFAENKKKHKLAMARAAQAVKKNAVSTNRDSNSQSIIDKSLTPKSLHQM